MNNCDISIFTGASLVHTPESEMKVTAIGSAPEMMTLSDAAKILPRRCGKRVNVSTLWRWCRKGIRGVFLRYHKIGRTIYISVKDLNMFFESLAAVDKADRPNTAAPRVRNPGRRPNSLARERELENARAILVRAKILQEVPQS